MQEQNAIIKMSVLSVNHDSQPSSVNRNDFYGSKIEQTQHQVSNRASSLSVDPIHKDQRENNVSFTDGSIANNDPEPEEKPN